MIITRLLGFLVFFTAFLLVYLGAHGYVFLRLSYLFRIRRTIWAYLVIILLALSFPVSSFFEGFIDGKLAKIAYTLSAVWLGMLLLLLLAVVIYDLLRLFFRQRLDSRTTGFVIISVVALLSAYSIVNAISPNVKTIEIPMPNLEKELKIVHLSDIHVGTIHNAGYLQDIAGKVNALNPDMVLITGDLFDGSGILTLESIKPLDNIQAATFFSLGNHEQYEGVNEVISLINQTKVQTLRNEIIVYKGIQIIGIDSPNEFQTKRPNYLESIILNKSIPSVLMYHFPTDLENSNQAGINLQLSGHTHAGQLFPFNLIERIAFSYMGGLYKINNTYLYVSPGTGTWGPPFRLGSKSEITVINLVKED